MHMCNILNRIITVSRVCICWWNTAESRYSATVLHLRWNQQRDKFKSLSSLRYGTCRHLLLPILQKLATLCYHQVATTCHFLLPPSCRHLPLSAAITMQTPATSWRIEHPPCATHLWRWSCPWTVACWRLSRLPGMLHGNGWGRREPATSNIN